MKIKGLLLMFVSVLALCGCAEKESEKQFYVYDALSAYKGKPADLSSEGFSYLSLLYEGFLLGKDKEPDWDKISSRIDQVNRHGIRTVSTDIEHWYSSRDPEGIKSGLAEIFDTFKEKIPGCIIGNYGVPVADLNILRYASSLKGKTEEEILARWISDSRRRMQAAEVCDVLFPSMYAMNDDLDQYGEDVKITAEYIRENFPGKKIIAYLWPQFYNLHSEPVDFYQRFMTGKQWSKVLEVCYDNFDGVVLWCHGRDENDVKVSWEDPRVQEIYEATRRFMAAHRKNIVKPMDSGLERNLLMECLEVPQSYDFDPEIRLEKTYFFDAFDAELLIQKNGPQTYQRVLKVFPKEHEGKLPAVVVPYYFPEVMIGFELDTQEEVSDIKPLPMMAHLAARGFACISADSYHLTYLESDKPRADFTRWQDAGNAISADWPQWCGMGKLVADTRLLVDALEQDERIDASRIGIAGHSLGGKMAFYTGCLDSRIKVILASDFGFLWHQTNWEKNWYFGDKVEALKAAGLSNVDMLSYSKGKPFFLIAGETDTDASLDAMKLSSGYEQCPGHLGFLNHATGHRPPQYALEEGYDYLEKYLK